MRRLFPLALILATLPMAIQAQQVYRCGSSFSQRPCGDGGAVAIAAASGTPSREEVARSVASAKADAQRADAMEKARLAQEAKAPKAIVLQAPRAAASARIADAPKAKLEKGQRFAHFTAVSPAPGKKRKD